MRTRYIIMWTLILGLTLATLVTIRPNSVIAPPREVTSFKECINAGYPVMESYPRQCQVSGGELFTEQVVEEENASRSNYGETITVKINEVRTFTDGLEVTLTQINDSRCQPDVQCIWDGELSTLVSLQGGAFGANVYEIRLGTVNQQSLLKDAYTFTLIDASVTDATFVILKTDTEEVSVFEEGYVNGHVTLSPLCPVERVDEPCDVSDDVYTSRNLVVFDETELTVRKKIALDKDGNYAIALPQGTYYLQIQPAGIGEGEKKKVIIIAKETKTLDFDIDTGIR